MADEAGAGETQRSGGTKLVLLVVAAVVLLVAARRFEIQARLREALAWVEGAGPTAPLVFFGLYVTACVAMLPGALLTLGAGALFGLAKGFALVSVSSTVGATAAFLIGRHLARDAVARRVEGNERFRAIDEAVATQGWKIIGLTRLSPVFPFNLLNYALGLTRVSLRDYVLASWIGMMPGTMMYVYLGSLAGSLTEVGAGDRDRSSAEWALYAVGLAATIAVTVVITRIARGALAQRIESAEGAR